MISNCLTREETVKNFWLLGISSHGKEEVWFVEVPENGHSILEQLGHKSRASYIRGGENEFAF